MFSMAKKDYDLLWTGSERAVRVEGLRRGWADSVNYCAVTSHLLLTERIMPVG